MTTPTVAPPPEAFNFAQYLMDCNAMRPAKAAFVDDQGSLSVCDLGNAQQGFRDTGDQGVRGVRCAPDPIQYAFVDADGTLQVRRLVGRAEAMA